MIGKVVTKKCAICGKKCEQILGSRLVREVSSGYMKKPFVDYLTIPNYPCGCLVPKEFIYA